MSLDRLLRPSLIESHSQEWKDGTISGWIPGTLSSIEDDDIRPGRVRTNQN
ncbi:MAG: hypothetical protein HC781_22940 [Leptolyngbyaceae cyanobacterium CSU_1_4]|nr:hypothetical protein [Leptolyngbyaceae cyanobacterium CSU_1_4]